MACKEDEVRGEWDKAEWGRAKRSKPQTQKKGKGVRERVRERKEEG